MSQSLINHSPDLKALVNDGYEVAIVADHLVVYNVPYVNSKRHVKRGTLVSVLELAGDTTTTPSTHVAMFAGEHPCDREGRELKKIKHGSGRSALGDGLAVDHSFSSKPVDGYRDYHHKMTTYIGMISGPARSLDPNATAQTRQVIQSDNSDTPFKYIDTGSTRAGITAVSKKLRLDRVAIVGLGGTGSYILDLISKTPVQEIHLFDEDEFLQHNAFRSPGAPSVNELRDRPKKVHYHASRYAPMRNGIVAHDCHIDVSNSEKLGGLDFVFICVDKGNAKQPIVETLEELGVPFIDVGMGISLVDEQLLGIVRVTISTPGKRDHVRRKKRINLSGAGEDDVYSQNIQIADLNALNAALAVIKWKKLFGFYLDLEHEHHSTYTLDGNCIANEDQT